MSVETLTGVRLSSCASCLRKGFYEGTKAPQSPLTQSAEDLFEIRRAQNDGLVAIHAAQMRDEGDDVELEAEIPWGPDGCWTGHADLVNHTRKLVREYTGTDGCDLDTRKVRQVAWYAKHFGYSAEVFVFDPKTGERRPYPVNVEAFGWEMDNIEIEITDALALGEAPERVCKTPSDGPAMFCGFRDHCFEGWRWPSPAVCDDPDVIALAEELAALDEQVKKGAETVKRQKELKALLAGLVEHGVDVQCGSVKVRISDVAAGETFPLGDFVKAGFSLAANPDRAAEFVKPRSGSSRVSTKRFS